MNRLNLKVRKTLSQILHSLAQKLEPSEQEIKETVEVSRQSSTGEKSRLFSVKLPSLPPKVQTRLERVGVVPAYLQQMYQRYPLHRHPKFWLGMGLMMGMGSSAMVIGWGIYRLESSLPQSVEDIISFAPKGSLTLQSSDGAVLQKIGDIPYEQLKIWQFPDRLLQAFIASEDRRFEDHKGVDFQGISRAMWANITARDVVEGGSTITQQLARNVFLSQERSFERKIKEVRLAQKIEQNFTKGEILERYLNTVYLGSGAYGVADAAWVYFSKPVEKLTLTEAATLAGIVPAPSVYSPLEDQQAAKERRNLVLQRMAEEGYITPEEAKKAIASPLVINPSQPKRLQRQAPYFTDYVLKELPKYVSKEAIRQGGLTVQTTLNSQWQKSAEESVKKAVTQYGGWQGFKQAALVAIDPRNGQIKTMVGGNDFENNQYNRVTQAQRQPGSTFKTFVYATAIAAGFSPYQSFLDAEYFVDGYKPENFGDTYSGQYVSLQNALSRSLNVVAVKTLVEVGWKPVIRIAKMMGIESEIKPTYSLALGAWEVNLLEITSAYGTLANHGVHQPVYGISRVLDRKGKVIYQANFKPTRALDEGTSAIMTWMLQGVVLRGTGQPAQIGRPVAGKTGTSDKARDLWFIGYIPQMVTGVWLGNDDNQPTWGASTTAVLVWRDFMEDVVKNMPVSYFAKLPDNVEKRKGMIKAEPVKPKHSYYTLPKPKEEPETDNNTNGVQQTNNQQENYPRRRRRSRQQANYSNPRQYTARRTYSTNRSRNSFDSPSRNASVATTTPVNTPSTLPSESVPLSATPPTANISPPAPPAAPKN